MTSQYGGFDTTEFVRQKHCMSGVKNGKIRRLFVYNSPLRTEEIEPLDHVRFSPFLSWVGNEAH